MNPRGRNPSGTKPPRVKPTRNQGLTPPFPSRDKFLAGTPPLTMSARFTTDLAKLLVRTTDLRSCRNWGYRGGQLGLRGAQADPRCPRQPRDPPAHQLVVVHHGQLDVLGLAVHRVLGSADLQGHRGLRWHRVGPLSPPGVLGTPGEGTAPPGFMETPP